MKYIILAWVVLVVVVLGFFYSRPKEKECVWWSKEEDKKIRNYHGPYEDYYYIVDGCNVILLEYRRNGKIINALKTYRERRK